MVIKYGEMFELGKYVPHRLICGDTNDPEIIKRLVAGLRINLILTDVPYGVSYVEGKRDFSLLSQKDKVIINDQTQSDEEYRQFTRKWLEAVRPYLAPKNAAYIFNCDKMLFALREGMIDAGFTLSQLLIWVKNNSVIGRKDYLPQHELIVYGWYGKHAFFKAKDKSLLFYPKPVKSNLHPTQKPVGLLRRLILNSSQIGDVVFDSFAGSGSTGIACEQTRRQCLMVELDPDYCRVTIDRFEKLTGVAARKV